MVYVGEITVNLLISGGVDFSSSPPDTEVDFRGDTSKVQKPEGSRCHEYGRLIYRLAHFLRT
jgi:hypothetical protein